MVQKMDKREVEERMNLSSSVVNMRIVFEDNLVFGENV